jgi:hypothetical protein
VEPDRKHLRALAERYERLAQRLDACGHGAFLREMARGYQMLAGGCLSGTGPRAPRLGRVVTGHYDYTPAICETPESLSNNNAIRA